MFEEDYNPCDRCKHGEKECDEKPCNTCMQWVDGYLEAVNFENKHSK